MNDLLIGPGVQAEIDYRHEDRRQAFVMGSTIPVQCARCEEYRSHQDRAMAEAGRPVSLGICKSCKAMASAAEEERIQESPCR